MPASIIFEEGRTVQGLTLLFQQNLEITRKFYLHWNE